MARTYKRDSKGRFAGGGGGSGGGGKSRPATKQLQRGANRLTRDNAGRITSVGGSGATAYGGRIRTASGKRRATTVAKGIGKAPKGTVGKPRGLKADKNAATKAQTNQQPKTRTIAKTVKATERQRNIRSFMDQNRGATARDLKRDAQAFRTPLGKKDQKPGGPKTVGGALKELASKSRSRTAMGTGLTGDERRKAERLIGDNNVKGYRIVRGQRGDYLEAVSGVSSKAASLAEAAVSRAASRSRRVTRPNRIEMAKGRNAVLTQQKNALNKQLKEINAKIKTAGPNAGAFRLQKLQIQSRLSETRLELSRSQSVSKGNA